PAGTGGADRTHSAVQAVVYADVGFRYKYSMSDVVIQNAATAQAMQGLVAALGRRSVVLVGMMGAGKSSIGRRLAARLGLNFFEPGGGVAERGGQDTTRY